MKNKIYNNLNIENLMKTEWINQFDEKQIWQIEMGITRSKVDVSIYAKPKFDWKQMQQIRLGLEAEIDVSLYANSEYRYEQMEQICFGLISGLDVSCYLDNKYNWKEMEEIRIKLLKEKRKNEKDI